MMKSDFYYFVKDVINCSPGELGNNFTYVSNQHLISKEAIREIFKDEIKEKKPHYKILINILIIQNNYLRPFSRGAIYGIIEVVDELRFCFISKFKNVKKKSIQVILGLFATLYFEYVIMPGRKEEGKEYLNKFRKVFSKDDIIEMINFYGPLYKWIFERHGLDLGFGKEEEEKLTCVLEKFYSSAV